MKKVIYLAAGNGKINNDNYDITYQDLEIKRDIGGCMLNVDLSSYDILIATPPCNYWSRANPYYKTSKYALLTKELLPKIIDRFIKTNKPFIVENVINKKRMFTDNKDLFNLDNIIYFEHGRHCYFTNIYFDVSDIPTNQQFKYGGVYIGNKGKRQGGEDVQAVLERFLESLKEKKENE